MFRLANELQDLVDAMIDLKAAKTRYGNDWDVFAQYEIAAVERAEEAFVKALRKETA